MKIFEVIGQPRYVGYIADYDNGILTTGGLYHGNEIREVKDEVLGGISYGPDGRTELPVNWPDMMWADDNNKRQKIKSIDFDTEEYPPFIMEDGTRSWEVMS